MMCNSIILTGATGFIGAHLLKELIAQKYEVKCLLRDCANILPSEVEKIDIQKYCRYEKTRKELDKNNTLIHIAGLTPSSSTKHSSDNFYVDNVELTKKLADAAVRLGVKRFIFLSSIGVCGAQAKTALTENSIPNPIDEYSKSKLKAEMLLLDISKTTDMEVVILRPPMVYGPNALGNFNALVKLVKLGVPLPIGALNNKKTFCGVDNLIDFILACVDYKQSLNDMFLIGDSESVSTKELVQYIGEAIEKPIRTFPVPIMVLNALGILIGKTKTVSKLSSSLEIDISKAVRILNWKPSVSARNGISHAAAASVRVRSEL